MQATNSYDDANRITGLRHVDVNTGILQAEYLYELDGLGNRQIATETLRLPDSGGGGLQTTFITYSYDPLYRLTGASHTGGITATYSYVYDSVGNMTAYTETVGTETSSVNRVFDDANQLLVATDTELGTTSFYYDGNGNLIQIMPPGASGQNLAGTLRYDYNQRNLLITNTLYISDTGWVEQAAFTYDGDNNRVQQVDASGSQPITTTYINDNTGLSQVLVASTGITTTHYLMELDLMIQDNGLETRILLADGLGSARTELVGNVIQTVTTFEPYGKMLAQTGDSGTVYGYTGEQYDSATSLVYLRARYYNPNLKVFMSRDPFPGYQTLPASQHPYSYVHNNPVNLTDPGGEQAGEGAAVGGLCVLQPEVCLAVILIYAGAITVKWAIDNDIDINWPSSSAEVVGITTQTVVVEGGTCTDEDTTPYVDTDTDTLLEQFFAKAQPQAVPAPQPQPEEESTPFPIPPDWPDDDDDGRKAVVIGAGPGNGLEVDQVRHLAALYDNRVILNDIEALATLRWPSLVPGLLQYHYGPAQSLGLQHDADIFSIAPNYAEEIPQIAEAIIGIDSAMYVAIDPGQYYQSDFDKLLVRGFQVEQLGSWNHSKFYGPVIISSRPVMFMSDYSDLCFSSQSPCRLIKVWKWVHSHSMILQK